HAAALRELEGVGEQVLEYLLQPRRVRVQRCRHARLEDDGELQASLLRQRAETALELVAQVVDARRREVEHGRRRSGFDLGEIEQVVDQDQQVDARIVNRL